MFQLPLEDGKDWLKLVVLTIYKTKFTRNRNVNFHVSFCEWVALLLAQEHPGGPGHVMLYLGNTYFIPCLLSLDRRIGWNYENIY